MSLPPLEPLEVSSGMVFGTRRAGAVPPLPEPAEDDVRAVFATVLLEALTRSPCLVAFSGGRDSSAILARATQVAREHGLDDPIPATLRYAAHPRTQENEWQELVVNSLGLKDWMRLEIGAEFDALGSIATETLLRHGLYWPPNAHSMRPLLQAAAGGALLTGNGGDELMSPWRGRRLAEIRARKSRPHRSELKRVALGLLPYPAQLVAWRLRRPERLPWLTPMAQRRLAWAVAERLARPAPRWRDDIDWLMSSRYLELAGAIFRAMADDAGALLVQPFLDPRVAAAVLAAAPPDGFRDRTHAMDALFGDVLPPEVVLRSTKAAFTEIFWGPEVEAFSRAWDGTGLDPAFVDADLLRRRWLSPRPDFRSLTPMQAAWLAQRRTV
jgi:asparagine synthetase B (glutamine-hydrolysing)